MKLRHSLLFLCTIVACLAVLCVVFPPEGIRVGSITLRFPSLHKVLAKERKPNVEEILANDTKQKQQKILADLQDSIAYMQSLADSSNIRFWFPKGEEGFFDDLFAQLETAKSDGRIIRIVHYGDSQIEMDRMTQELRTYMQSLFGGGGPGMQPGWQTIPSFAVNQYTSGSFSILSSYGDNTVQRANGNYGPLARCAHLAGSGTISFKASKQNFVDERVRRFRDVKVIFNNRPGPLTVSLDGDNSGSQTIEEPGVHAFEWSLPMDTNSLRIHLSGDADIYGILVDNGPGVAVDNVPLRGCSGQQFSMINPEQLETAYGLMDVGLIILQFGGNSVPYLRGPRNTAVYAQTMGRQIDFMHKVCPQAKVLFIGPSDMATNVDGERQSYPFLPSVVQMLRDTVTAHGAAYWSIYDAMGGKNSMAAWVNEGLAVSDYIHFSMKGVHLMGQRLADAFDQMYRIFLLRKRAMAAKQDTLTVNI
ncbi:MAG: hypothetical protein SPJ13_08340 [Bacteroidales bacterium]|nr:hypothetical protein [Bacteroidales bacterium]